MANWGLLSLLILPLAELSAQAPRYTRPDPPSQNTIFEVRARFMLTPSVQFSGFGNIDYQQDRITSDNIALGTERGIVYDDGFIRQDYISTELVSDDGGSEIVASGNTTATSFFGYSDPSQVDAAQPDVLNFHLYKSTGTDVAYEAEVENGAGWELAYTRFLSDRRRLGWQIGFGFNGFDSTFNDSVTADLYIQQFSHQMAGGVNVPDLPTEETEDSEGNTVVETNVFVGDRVREDQDSGDLLEWAAQVVEGEETVELEGATVDSQARLRSTVYSFRAGPTYSLNLGSRFNFNLGAGVSAIYYSGNYSVFEQLQNPTGELDPARTLTAVQDDQWQVAPYVDASASYWLSRRVSIFSGVQYQGAESLEQSNEERHAAVDFKSQVFVHAGFGVRF